MVEMSRTFKGPLSSMEYAEFRNLSELTERQRGEKGHLRYLELRFRHLMNMDKR